jgi:hypothetical protein
MWSKVEGLAMFRGLRIMFEANHFLVGAAMHEVHASQASFAQLLGSGAATWIFEKSTVC